MHKNIKRENKNYAKRYKKGRDMWKKELLKNYGMWIFCSRLASALKCVCVQTIVVSGDCTPYKMSNFYDKFFIPLASQWKLRNSIKDLFMSLAEVCNLLGDTKNKFEGWHILHGIKCIFLAEVVVILMQLKCYFPNDVEL